MVHKLLLAGLSLVVLAGCNAIADLRVPPPPYEAVQAAFLDIDTEYLSIFEPPRSSFWNVSEFKLDRSLQRTLSSSEREIGLSEAWCFGVIIPSYSFRSLARSETYRIEIETVVLAAETSGEWEIEIVGTDRYHNLTPEKYDANWEQCISQ